MNRLVGMLLGAALLAGTAAAQTAAPQAPAASPDTVVAVIGNENLTLGEFEQNFKVFVGSTLNQQGMPFDASMLGNFAEYRPDILVQVARQRGTEQLARAAGVSVDEAQVAQIVERNKAGFENQDAFRRALQQAGYNDEDQLRRFIAGRLLTDAYLKRVRERLSFPESVLNAYYRGNREQFERPAQACVKHILVPDEAAAQQVRSRLQAGEDFAAVAREVSQDPGSGQQGGDLGCLNQGETVPEFDRASFSGPLGELQQVNTQFGTHLLVVGERTPAGLVPFEQVRERVQQELAERALQAYLEGRLQRLGVETFPDRVAVPGASQ